VKVAQMDVNARIMFIAQNVKQAIMTLGKIALLHVNIALNKVVMMKGIVMILQAPALVESILEQSVTRNVRV
jgi:hypothetical protein